VTEGVHPYLDLSAQDAPEPAPAADAVPVHRDDVGSVPVSSPPPDPREQRRLDLTRQLIDPKLDDAKRADLNRQLRVVLDGEVAIFDQQLRSRFDWLREPDPDAVATPPMFMVFDLLHRDGRELTGRARLEDAVADNDLVLPVRRLARNGFEAWSEVVAHDYEGYVAKDEASLYEAGLTRRWLKVKQKGWTDQEDRWQRRISSRA
jgi:ATP-dependent DNA ligase